MKVLIVDDAMFMRLMLKKILAEAGYECFEAGSGVEAVQRFGELRPELVTVDITMPEMDGIAAVKAMRAIDPAARFIMCSAMGQQERVMDAIQAGACDFIVKPFKPERVLEAVKKACERAAV